MTHTDVAITYHSPFLSLLLGPYYISYTSLDGWSYSGTCKFPPTFSPSRAHPGMWTAGDDRELALWPFLPICLDTV